MQPARVHVGPMVDSDTSVAAPLRLYRATVRPEWVDYNGHMSEWCFLLVMGESSDAFFRYVGIDEHYRSAGASLFTVETHIRNLVEVGAGDELSLALHVLAVDAKRIHLTHEVTRRDGSLAATGEQLLLHVDTTAGRVAPILSQVRQRIDRVAQAHASLPRPDWIGHVMQIPEPGPTPEKGSAAWTSS